MLKLEPLGQRCFVGLEDALLRNPGGERRLFSNFARDLEGFGEVLLVGDDPAHEPVSQSVARRYLLSSEYHVHRLVLSEGPREPLCSTGTRHHAYINLGLSQFCPLGRDDDVAGHRKFEPASERIPAHGGYQRLCDLLNFIKSLKVSLPEGLHRGLIRHALDIRPGGENAVVAGDDYTSDSYIRVEFFESLHELLH